MSVKLGKSAHVVYKTQYHSAVLWVGLEGERRKVEDE
jgi:hypothetical protein